MSDLPVLPEVETIEPTPAEPVASKGKKGRGVKSTEPFVPTVATFPDDAAAAPLNPTAAAPAETAIEETTIMATNVKNTAETLSADFNARAKEAVEKGQKFFAELNGFTKGNVEALVESGKIAVAGAQTMAQDQAAYLRKQFETATAAAKELAGVKSPTEFVKLQGDYVRQQFDGAVAEMSRSTEAMLKLAGEVAQPISNRVAVAVEKVKLAA